MIGEVPDFLYSALMRFISTFLVAFSFSFFAGAKTLVIVGDSLTEGYGVAKEKAYPFLLEKKIQAKYPKAEWKVINAGISGSTSASGPQRMAWQMKSKPDLVMIALGANDGLRGIKVTEIRKNLSATIELAQKGKGAVILAGMEMPPNYGKDYVRDFHNLFPELAQKYKIKLLPFLLDGVAGRKDLNQSDSIHPNEKGHQIIADMVVKFIDNLLL